MKVFFFKHDKKDWLSNVSNVVLRIKYGYTPTFTHCAIMVGQWWFEYSYHGLVCLTLNQEMEYQLIENHYYLDLGDNLDAEYLQAAWYTTAIVKKLHPKFSLINLIKVSVFNIPVVSCVGLVQLILNMEWEVLSPDGLHNTLLKAGVTLPCKRERTSRHTDSTRFGEEV